MKSPLYLVIALAIVAVTYGQPGNSTHEDLVECEVGEWSEWSSCTASRACGSRRSNSMRTFHRSSAVWDSGRLAMAQLMRGRVRSWQHRGECAEGSTCPEMSERPSQGPEPCHGGLAGDIPCHNIEQLAFVSFVDLGYAETLPNDYHKMGNDCWGWTDPENGDEYALMGLSAGTSFVRITDPTRPVTVGFLWTQTEPSTWRDIKVIGNFAYIGSEARGHGMQVFDLTQLRGVNELKTFKPTAVYSKVGSSHNIVENVETGFIYIVGAGRSSENGCAGGLHAVNVSNPHKPRFAGCFSEDGYTHDAQCVIYRGPDLRYQAREVCFNYNEDTLTIVDVTDKRQMSLISKTGYDGAAYTHQGILTADHSVLLLDDELDELYSPEKHTRTYIWDIRDLEEPTLENVYVANNEAIDHNQYIVAGFTYQANYASGLRVLHVDQENYDLQEVAYFDVFPMIGGEEDSPWVGSWNVYPYFSSGNMIISSIDYGMFIVRPDYDAMTRAVNDHVTLAESRRTRPLISAADGVLCPPLVETRPCEMSGHC